MVGLRTPCRVQRVKCDQVQTSGVMACTLSSKVTLLKNQQIYGGVKTVHLMFPIGKIKLNSTTESDKHTLKKYT